MASASCGRSVLNSWAKSSKRASCCKLFGPGGRVADSQRKAVPAIAELELALEIGAPEIVWRGAGRERRACTQRSRQPVGSAVEKEFLAEGDFLGRLRVVRRDCRSGRVGGEANLLERFRLGQWTGFGNGMRFGVAGRAASSDRACLPAPSRPKLSAPAAIATRSPIRNRLCFAVVILNRLSGGSPTSVGAVGPALIKRPASKAPSSTLVSRGRPSSSQTSRSAYASSSISWPLWKGVGVMRSRSVPAAPLDS
jgi:hypothetical protein